MFPVHRSFADPSCEINDLQRKPRENSILAENPSKYTTSHIVLLMKLQVALWTYMFLKFGLNNEKFIHTLSLQFVPFLSL